MELNLQPTKRIAAVHDLSGFGKCSLTMALPVISACGVECACIPTALLSTHTGEFKNFRITDLSGEMVPIADHWRAEGIAFDGVYSGYLASPEQEKQLEQVIDRLAGENTLIIVDPVMADNGEYYHSFDIRMCESFRRLCRRAAVITPNITEAALLTGMDYRPGVHEESYVNALLDGLSALCPGTVVITGVRPDEGRVGAVARDAAGRRSEAYRPVRPGVFYGTGDLLASSLAALLVRGASADAALQASVALVGDSIERTYRRGSIRRFGVDFEGALSAHIRRVDEIFNGKEATK